MPRKAKPLRMWMIKAPDGDFCYTLPQKTRFDAIYDFERGDISEWPRDRKRGYRAVRVTVKEDVK